ncbi:hypothetical protein GCM10023331_24100 [Algivirga pacifica]|uniref:DUF4468 domain-containing protein n=2 Tax=Algivirga pacifica TaxID=1162670 RepID=A0ABP9DAZ7_9BACT
MTVSMAQSPFQLEYGTVIYQHTFDFPQGSVKELEYRFRRIPEVFDLKYNGATFTANLQNVKMDFERSYRAWIGLNYPYEAGLTVEFAEDKYTVTIRGIKFQASSTSRKVYDLTEYVANKERTELIDSKNRNYTLNVIHQYFQDTFDIGAELYSK